MAKLLIEYKGIPAIIDHTLENFDKVTFIVTYKSEENLYLRKDFMSIDTAMDFEPDNKTKLIFAYLTSKPDENKTFYVIYKSVQFVNNKFIISGSVDELYRGYDISVDFSYSTFRIKKTRVNVVNPVFDILYSRRKTVEKDGKKEFELIDSFYELVPRYEDMFLETIFFFDILRSNILITDKSEIEAYFLQAKVRIDGQKKLPKQKDKNVEEQQPALSNELLTLESLIGLQKIKLEIQELKALANFRQKRLELGLPVTPTTLHMIFTGNPGTGKTTVARLLGKIYYDMGILSEDKLIEASRQDLVGEYIGHTAPKTQKLFESALGGILFIDEAYSLFKTGNDFGKEAIETLLKLMEDNREKIVVIIAGYPNEMDDLLSSNPGLKSRFSTSLHFDDYSKDELLQIFIKMVADYHNVLTDGAKFKIEHLIESSYDTRAFAANARALRNLVEETTKRQSLRLSKLNNPQQDEMITCNDKALPTFVA